MPGLCYDNSSPPWVSDIGSKPYFKSVTLLTSNKASIAELTDICFASPNYFQWKLLLCPTFLYFLKILLLSSSIYVTYFSQILLSTYMFANLPLRKLPAK